MKYDPFWRYLSRIVKAVYVYLFDLDMLSAE